jgi:hypothetical protein
MGFKTADDQHSGQETERDRVRICTRTDRGRRLPLIAASIAVLPVLAGCSTSASYDYSSAAAAAYPSQSLADLFKGSLDSPPPVRMAAQPPASPNSSAVVAGPANASGPGAPNPTGSGTATAAVPAASPDDYYRSAASAYPSVSLSDLLSGSAESSGR